jgi:hypothetical protein
MAVNHSDLDDIVQGFLAFELPRVSSEIISTKAKLWFSRAQPSTDYKNMLLARSIPSQDFVEQLSGADMSHQP